MKSATIRTAQGENARTLCPTSGNSIHCALLPMRSEEHTSELQSQSNLVCRLLLEKKERMNEVAAALGQDRYELLISRHHGLELVLRAAPRIEEERNEPDALGQQANDLLGHPQPHD